MMNKVTITLFFVATFALIGSSAMADWNCEGLVPGISDHLLVTSVSPTVINAKEVQGAGIEKSYVFTYDAKMKAFEYPVGENTGEGIADIKSYTELSNGDLQLALRVAKDTSGFETTDVKCIGAP